MGNIDRLIEARDNRLERERSDSYDEYDAFVSWCESNDLDPEETDIEKFREYVEEERAQWIIGQREIDALYHR